MSWHTCIVFIDAQRSASLEACLHKLGWTFNASSPPLSFENATSGAAEGRAYATVGGWHVIADPVMFMDLMDDLPPTNGFLPPMLEQAFLTERWSVIAILLEGSSGTYGLARYSDGRRIRCLLTQEDVVIVDEGTASTEEKAAFSNNSGDSEQSLLDYAQAATGIFEQFGDAEFRLLS